MIIRLRSDLRLHFHAWPAFKHVHFGPKSWPWWRILSLCFVVVPDDRVFQVVPPSWTVRMWAYTRWCSKHWDFTIDWNPQWSIHHAGYHLRKRNFS